MAATKTDDPRLKVFIAESLKLPDANTVIAERTTEVQAENSKGIPVTETVNLSVTKKIARVDFGDFVAQSLRPDEALSVEDFEYLRAEYPQYQKGNRDFESLTQDERERYMHSIDEAQHTLLDAFSAANSALASSPTVPINKRQIRDALTDMPANVNEVDACFHAFCEDESIKDILGKSDLAGQFRAFKVARLVAGVIETDSTRNALEKYANEFDLAS